MSVFNEGLGPDRPLAAPWDAFHARDRESSQATIRDRTGRPVRVSTSFLTIVPGLDVAALAADKSDLHQ